jgi:hypothetical protein
MKCTFHPEAEAEFLDAIGYYEDCEPGLGYDFAIEVHSTIESILSYPKAWTILDDDVRRCQTRRFPPMAWFIPKMEMRSSSLQ